VLADHQDHIGDIVRETVAASVQECVLLVGIEPQKQRNPRTAGDRPNPEVPPTRQPAPRRASSFLEPYMTQNTDTPDAPMARVGDATNDLIVDFRRDLTRVFH